MDTQVDWIKCMTRRLRCAARRQAGITLVETVVAIVLFGIVSTGLITVLASATIADGLARQRSIALELAQQQMEYVRQLNYSDIGTVGGNPPGVVLISQSKTVSGLSYLLSTRIKYVNDPVPTSFVTFANYKQVRVIVTRASDGRQLASVVTYVSSATRAPSGGLNNGVVNVAAQDYWTHDSLGGVSIELTKTWNASFHTGDSTDDVTGSPTFGQVTFPALEATPTSPLGYYEVAASLSGYATLSDDEPPNDPAHLQLAPSGTTNTTIHLYKPSSIHISVIDETTGNLYTGPTTVTIASQSRGISEDFTTSTGIVDVSNQDTLGTCPACEPIVPASDYSITLTAEVTGGHRTGALAGQTVPVDYSALNPSASFQVTLDSDVTPSLATVTIYVKHVSSPYADCNTGSAMSNAAVTFDDDPNHTPPYYQSGNTNSSGRVIFSNVPLGTYDMTASKRVSGRNRQGGLSDQSVTGDTTFCIPVVY
jgi:type II secretory pathway pseudopilin PulG